MSDNQNLPVNVGTELEVGTITYANEVIAIIAGMATYEVEGVVNTAPSSGGIADLFGRKSIMRGVKVEVGTEETSVDLVITVEYGKPIQKVATEVQENVRKAIESMTGLLVLKVDVHVSGISFEKEKEEIEESYVRATSSVKDRPASPDGADSGEPSEDADPASPPEWEDEENDVDMQDVAQADSALARDQAPEGGEE